MHLRTLKVFCDLAETGSFTRTAKMNGLTQSAVSQQMNSLQKIFKLVLLERIKRKYRLTREGQVVYDRSRQILGTYELLQGKLQELRDVISGTIRVATIYSIGLHDLPRYIKRFLRMYPGVNIHVEYRRADKVYEDVLGNLADFGLVAYPQRQAKIEILPFHKDRLVVICHPQHPFAGQKAVSLKELAGQNFIGFEPDIPTRKAIDGILLKRRVQVNVVIEFDNIETVKRAVEINAGVSIVPQGAVAQEVANQTLFSVPIGEAAFYRPIGVVHRKDKVFSPAMQQFLTILRDGN